MLCDSQVQRPAPAAASAFLRATPTPPDAAGYPPERGSAPPCEASLIMIDPVRASRSAVRDGFPHVTCRDDESARSPGKTIPLPVSPSRRNPAQELVARNARRAALQRGRPRSGVVRRASDESSVSAFCPRSLCSHRHPRPSPPARPTAPLVVGIFHQAPHKEAASAPGSSFKLGGSPSSAHLSTRLGLLTRHQTKGRGPKGTAGKNGHHFFIFIFGPSQPSVPPG